MAMGIIKKRIPLFDTFLDETEVAAVAAVIRSGWLSQGEKVEEFEREFCTLIGSKYAVAVSSCTAALHLSLIAAGVSATDEVITTPLTFIATINSILHQRAKPVFADISPRTLNIDPARIQEKITERTRAIIPVHYAGLPADMKAINRISRRHNLAVIEDAAHALGAQYYEKLAGNLGDYGCFSFYPGKNITTGEGGMIALNDEQKAEQIRRLRCHGMTSTAFRRDRSYIWEYDIDGIGYNYRMTEIEAALGIVQLSKIAGIIKKRRRNAEVLSNMFEDVEQITPQYVAENTTSAYYFYPIVVERTPRDKVLAFLRRKGIMAAAHYRPAYLFQPHRDLLGLKEGHCPISEDIYNRIISLPCHQGLDEDDMSDIAEQVIQALD